MIKIKYLISVFILVAIFIFASSCKSNRNADGKEESNRLTVWSPEKAQKWAKNQPWLCGTNYIPSTAINSLEMWQAETFDPVTIDRELGWAESLGFNCMRVFLHHLAWEIDKDEFKKRMNDYLTIADKHKIKTMFVLFDDCWSPVYHAGKQPDPKPGVHNSGWVQDPGSDLFDTSGNVNTELMKVLEAYIKDVLTTFSNDNRILAWDLYNEPGNSRYRNRSMYLLKKVFIWAREVNPGQPVTSGIWNKTLTDLNYFQLHHSDIITYHNYNDEVSQKEAIDSLKTYQRPLICTEYMARTRNSRFENIMPLLKENGVGAINWGLVSGKTNTIYAWDTPMPDGSEPELWFHDILREDGTPYKQEEVDLIKKLCRINHGVTAKNPKYMVHNKTILVDADTADWAGVPSNSVCEASHLWIGQGMYKEYWKGTADLSFTWRAAWHQNTLYFLFVVTDDVISQFNQSYTWLNDCVEICLDPHNSKGIRKDTINGKISLHGYEMHFLPSQPAHCFLHDDQPYFTSKDQDKDFINIWNGKIAVKDTPNGYILELAFSVPGIKLTKGTKLGLETAVCDDDGNGRKSLLTWTGLQTDYWISMDKYGILTIQ